MNLMEIVRYSQNSQNSKFLMSLQYLKEEVTDEVDILHVERQSFLQVGIIIFYGSGQICPKYPKEVGNIFAIY